MLLLFGLGLTVGGTLGGKLADWRRMPSLIATLALIGIVLALFAGTMHMPFATLATIFVWGILAFAIVPPLQIMIVDRASDAPNLASTLKKNERLGGYAARSTKRATVLLPKLFTSGSEPQYFEKVSRLRALNDSRAPSVAPKRRVRRSGSW